ncbi:MAG: DUF4397 domain-containing protein [Pedobacter sp.]|nr:DUF4397 domain-containing protein [Pedobacter sp.]MDQ8053172.1 DUF4397 domain-containing protein [Pedobacter sp.]
MKKTFSKISLFSLLAILVILGCEKNKDNVFSDYIAIDDTYAFLKVNYNVPFYNDPFVQVKINDVRVSGTNIQTRYPFPGGGFNTLGGSTGDYLPVKPSPTTKISVTIPKKGTNIDSIDVYTTTVATVAGGHYSLHVADSLSRKGLFVGEDYSLPDSGFVRMRFVNLMPTAGPLDLYVGTNKVASNVSFMTITDSFLVPTSQAAISTSWTIRTAGSAPTSTAIATYSTASSLLNRRVYTAFACGYVTYPSSGADKRRPFIAFYYVR